jgi:hypothetical protein
MREPHPLGYQLLAGIINRVHRQRAICHLQ